MMLRKFRKFYKTNNKYEDHIVLLTFLPSLLIFIVFSAIFFLMASATITAISQQSPSVLESWIHQWFGVVVGVLCVIFVSSLVYAFAFAHHLVGAFGRIITELDEIIAGRSQRPIKARPDDELANELLKRVNVLIQSYIEHKK